MRIFVIINLWIVLAIVLLAAFMLMHVKRNVISFETDYDEYFLEDPLEYWTIEQVMFSVIVGMSDRRVLKGYG